MTLNEYIEYIKNPLAAAKSRVVLIHQQEDLTTLHRFLKQRGGVVLRISDLVREDAWLPMPLEIFKRIRNAIEVQTTSGEPLTLLGLSGYLALLTDENKQAAIFALREWVDRTTGHEAVCMLLHDNNINLIIKDVFANPRYRQGKQLVTIESNLVERQFSLMHTKAMLVGASLAPFIHEGYDTFQKYLRHTEDHPNDNSVRKIVVDAEDPLSGLSIEVQQLTCLRDFARVVYGVEDTDLSEDTLHWICELAINEGREKTLQEILKTLLFPEGEISKRVLCILGEHRRTEIEATLWLVKQLAPKGGYLEFIIRQEGVSADNFRSAYVTGAAECLDKASEYSDERKNAIHEAGVRMSDSDIRVFIKRCANESTSRIAPWLNCETDIERAELLRRCAVDGIVSSAVKAAYPETAAYLNTDLVFDEPILDRYFTEYRELKMTGRVTLEFYERARNVELPSSVQYRDTLVQPYVMDSECALLVVDAMGVEWLPMLIVVAQERNLGVESLAVGKAHLPTTTQFNSIHWPYPVRRLQDIKRFDNIAHNGAEAHETRSAEENLVAALDVIGNEVIPHVADGLTRFERVLVTADHGSSRLAVLAQQVEPILAQTLTCEKNVEIAHWRYRERTPQGDCPQEQEETLDGQYWVVRGYDRLPKRGGGQSFELHGGATLEERLVPLVIFSRKGQFIPKARTDSKRMQIVEKDDFDL